MKLRTIVISFKIFKQLPLNMVYVNKFVVVVPFIIQGSEKRFSYGIAPTIPSSAQTLIQA
jgi:hypothetical protein